MVPEVLGPAVIPRLDPPELRRTPVVGMLWTLAHLDDPACPEHALATLEALSAWDEDADGRLADILQAALPAALRARMEELMRTGKYEYQSDFAKKYFALGREEGREEGRAVGEVSALLLVLRARGIEVPSAAADRIDCERDAARIESWIRRAATATSIDDVFADE